MADMGKGYGSECHLLRYLGRHRDNLDSQVRGAIGCEAVRWLDFPFDRNRTWLDGEWKGLDFLPEDSPARTAWKSFWPQRGNAPNWDAVGQVLFDGKAEWLLVEAKAHLDEITSSCQASEKGGRPQIQRAFERAKSAFGVDPASDWLGPYYQYCNRLACLHFLLDAGEAAQLLFIYFTGDRFPNNAAACPADYAGWKDTLDAMERHVGLRPDHPINQRIHKLFLPVCPAAN